MSRYVCTAGHERAAATAIPGEEPFVAPTETVLLCEVCGALIARCEFCDSYASGYLVDEDTDERVYVCADHAERALSAGIMPPCVSCGEPVVWPTEMVCGDCVRHGVHEDARGV